MIDAARLYLLVFGVLTIAGGIMGYVKAKSRASLVAGGVAGLLLLLAGYAVGAGRTTAGLGLGLAVSIALVGRFGSVFAKSRKVMPAGLMTLLGAVGVVLTGLGLAR